MLVSRGSGNLLGVASAAMALSCTQSHSSLLAPTWQNQSSRPFWAAAGSVLPVSRGCLLPHPANARTEQHRMAVAVMCRKALVALLFRVMGRLV